MVSGLILLLADVEPNVGLIVPDGTFALIDSKTKNNKLYTWPE